MLATLGLTAVTTAALYAVSDHAVLFAACDLLLHVAVSHPLVDQAAACLLYTSDAADE